MSTKEIIDYLFRLLEILISWPAIFIIVTLLVRRELPTLLSKLADRITKAPGGFEFAALKEKVEDLNNQVEQLKEKINFEPSAALTPQVQKRLQDTLDAFRQYLKAVGFPISDGQVNIQVKQDDLTPHYEGEKRLIVVGVDLANDPYIALREYMHHALIVVKKIDFDKWPPVFGGLESGFADYFAASYANDPVLGRISSSYFAKKVEGFDKPYIRNLSNTQKFTDKLEYDNAQTRGEIWGGAFWDIREQLGQADTDKLLYLSWEALAPEDFTDQTGISFVRKLLTAAPNVTDRAKVASIRKIFQSRSLAGKY